MASEEVQLAKLFAKKFIARPDVMAVQHADGTYQPARNAAKESIGFDMPAMLRHLRGESTYGHYLLSTENKVKLLAFDVDFEKEGFWIPSLTAEEIEAIIAKHGDDEAAANAEFDELDKRVTASNPRADWRRRSHPGREFYKRQLRLMAEMLTGAIHKELEIPCAAAYSGHKGIHVYGFLPEPLDAGDVRQLGISLLESFGDTFTPTRGDNFFKDQRGIVGGDSLANFAIEVFPKQDAVEEGKFGNLMRLPLGVNQKAPKDPTFFLDQTQAHTMLVPHPDPVKLLTEGNPWA